MPSFEDDEEQIADEFSEENSEIDSISTKRLSSSKKTITSATITTDAGSLPPWMEPILQVLEGELGKSFSSLFKSDRSGTQLKEKLSKLHTLRSYSYSKESSIEEKEERAESIAKDSVVESEDNLKIPILPSVVHKESFSDYQSQEDEATIKGTKKCKKRKKSTSFCSICSPREIDPQSYEVKLKTGYDYPKERLYKNSLSLYTRPEYACLRVPIKEKVPKHLRVAPEAPLNMRLSALAEHQLNNTSIEHNAFDWSIERVGDWIAIDMRMPQYRSNFEENSINGRRLVLINAEALEQMGLSNFEDIIKISQRVREIFNLEMEVNVNLHLTKSRFDPASLFTMYNHKTGGEDVIGNFYKEHHMVLKKKPYCSLFEIKRNQWDLFPKITKTVNRRIFILKDFDSYPYYKRRQPSPRRLW